MNDPAIAPADDQAVPVAAPAPSDQPLADTAQDPAAGPTADPAAPQKSPLDLLEEMLGNNKPGDAAAAGSKEPTPPPQPPGPTQEEVDALGAQKALEDQAAAQAKLNEIHQEIQGVKHQDQIHTEEATHQQTEDQHDAQAGFQINQIGHTKIEENPG